MTEEKEYQEDIEWVFPVDDELVRLCTDESLFRKTLLEKQEEDLEDLNALLCYAPGASALSWGEGLLGEMIRKELVSASFEDFERLYGLTEFGSSLEEEVVRGWISSSSSADEAYEICAMIPDGGFGEQAAFERLESFVQTEAMNAKHPEEVARLVDLLESGDVRKQLLRRMAEMLEERLEASADCDSAIDVAQLAPHGLGFESIWNRAAVKAIELAASPADLIKIRSALGISLNTTSPKVINKLVLRALTLDPR